MKGVGDIVREGRRVIYVHHPKPELTQSKSKMLPQLQKDRNLEGCCAKS